ncbi:MAG TPA: hypothetical protein IAD32_04155 [Candidatus Scatavimonas merdigallinarum]|uniref:Uncharacterized protein n=1 Tax=Candidatus Scatavimonas merdigallinarum TaxID=2840914 RepID=A0A9D0ZH63_9FIRM|nr:hypothetical protein [Candidatus Scatavimonas merdigallinarum]
MSNKMKKSVSLILAILMIAAMSCIAATSASAVAAGTQIFFDNSATQWEHVYIYGWNYGLAGDFVELQPIEEGSNIYAYTLTYDTEDGENFCLFTSSTDWSGRQTTDIATEEGMNLWTPVASAEGAITGSWSYMTPPAAAPSVTATPSKDFAIEMNVTVNEFNCDGGARYTINGADPIAFDGSATFTIGGEDAEKGTVYTVVVTGYDDDYQAVATSTTTYTKVGMTTINATIDASYTGDVYAYLFGGDRIGAAFYEMQETTAAEASQRTFTLEFEGAAQVIFTTTDSWDTAVKLNGTAEPMVEAGATASFDLVYPAAA